MRLVAPLLASTAMATSVFALPESSALAGNTYSTLVLQPSPDPAPTPTPTPTPTPGPNSSQASKAIFETVVIHSSAQILVTSAAVPAATPSDAIDKAIDAAQKETGADILDSILGMLGLTGIL